MWFTQKVHNTPLVSRQWRFVTEDLGHQLSTSSQAQEGIIQGLPADRGIAVPIITAPSQIPVFQSEASNSSMASQLCLSDS